MLCSQSLSEVGVKLRWLLGLLAIASGCLQGDCPDEVPYDAIDQDCDGSDLVDVDGDGFDAVQADGADCNDNDASINPDATEVPYDGVDQDCSGGDLVDADGDGFLGVEGGDDCDDTDPATFPGAADDVGDGVDQNCDGIDGEDFDRDGFASEASGGDDCNDSPLDGRDINPGEAEIWYDGVDQDCDGACDFDRDGDGFVLDGHVPGDNFACDDNPEVNKVDFLEDCDDEDPKATDNFINGAGPSGTDEIGTQPVFVELTREESGATLEVFRPDGTQVAGSTDFVGRRFEFTPTVSFDTFTTYDVEFSGSCGDLSFSFTTGAFGPAAALDDLRDASFAIDLAGGFWSSPALGGSLQAAVAQDLLLGIDEIVSGTITTIAAVAEVGSGSQDVCIETGDMPVATFLGNPVVSVGPAPEAFLVFDDAGVVPVVDLSVTGLFSADATLLGNATVSGLLDARDLVPLLAPGGSAEDVCKANQGCGTCPDKSGDFCMAFQVDATSGAVVPGESVQRIDAADVSANPDCD